MKVSERIKKQDSYQADDAPTTHPVITEEPKWELKYLSPTREYASITDVAIGIRSILFADSEAGTPREEIDKVGTEKGISLLGDEWVTKDLLEGDTERPVIPSKTPARG